jgi:hypothetical protein
MSLFGLLRLLDPEAEDTIILQNVIVYLHNNTMEQYLNLQWWYILYVTGHIPSDRLNIYFV